MRFSQRIITISWLHKKRRYVWDLIYDLWYLPVFYGQEKTGIWLPENDSGMLGYRDAWIHELPRILLKSIDKAPPVTKVCYGFCYLLNIDMLRVSILRLNMFKPFTLLLSDYGLFQVVLELLLRIGQYFPTMDCENLRPFIKLFGVECNYCSTIILRSMFVSFF